MTTELATITKAQDIAQRICECFKESQKFKSETIHAGRQAVLKAIETGALLVKAKRLVGHGHWEKWFADNIADQAGISIQTAQRWMAMSKTSKMRDLKDTDSLTRAYIEAGIIADTKPALKAIGTAQVDIIETAFEQLMKRGKSFLSFAQDAQPKEWPADRKAQLKAELEPLVEIWRGL
jgi:hypothetical protein